MYFSYFQDFGGILIILKGLWIFCSYYFGGFGKIATLVFSPVVISLSKSHTPL